MAKRNLMDRVALIGGADPASLGDNDHRLRHLGVGFLVLTIAVWALIGGTHLGTQGFHLGMPAALVPGVLLAAIVGLIDMLITTTFLEARNHGAKLRLVGVRGLLSLGMGIVLGYLSLLLIYQSRIDQLVSDANRGKAETIDQDFRAHSSWTTQINGAKSDIAAGRAAVGVDNAAINTDNLSKLTAGNALSHAQSAVTAARKAWEDDTVPCTPGSAYSCNHDYIGPGSVSTPLEQAFKTELTVNLPAAQAVYSTAVANIDADIAKRNDDIANRNNDITAKQANIKDWNAALDKDAAKAVAKTLADIGTEAQNNALRHILATDPLAWIWPIFFLVIDLVIASLKAILPESAYDRRRREALELDNAVSAELIHSPEFESVRSHAAARKAEVAIARIDADTDRELAQIKEQRETIGGGHRSAPGLLAKPARSAATYQRRRAIAASSVFVVLLATGAIAAVSAHTSHQDHQAAAASTTPSSKPTVSAVRTMTPVAYQLAAPAAKVSAQTKQYLRGGGHVVVALHQVAATLDRQFTPTACLAGQKMLTSNTAKAIAQIPDPTMQELALDEVHELAVQAGCHTRQDANDLHRVVSVTTERLAQLGMPS